MTTKAKWFWVVFLIGLVADQATKLWIVANLAEGPGGGVIPVIPGWFDLVHAENPGAAFSMFASFEYRHYLFLVFIGVACWVVWDQFRKLPANDRLWSVALAMIASGAIGNGIDRVTKKTVTDFLRFHVETPGAKRWLIENLGTNEYPSFNIADSVLLVGVVFFVIAGNKEPAPASAPPADAPKAAPDA